VDAKVYVPPYNSVSIYFLKDLIYGKKRTIKLDSVKKIEIPQYFGLGLREIWNFLTQHQQVGEWLPVKQEIARLPKEFLANVAYTVLGDVFAGWV